MDLSYGGPSLYIYSSELLTCINVDDGPLWQNANDNGEGFVNGVHFYIPNGCIFSSNCIP